MHIALFVSKNFLAKKGSYKNFSNFAKLIGNKKQGFSIFCIYSAIEKTLVD